MATKKTIDKDEKFEKQDFDLFESLLALDKKDYQYFSKLSEEQKKKFVPYMMVHWMSATKGNKDIQSYYLQSIDYHANKYIFNENIQKHPELQWLMLCASSPGLGKQFHQWIPHLKDKVVKLKEPAKQKDIKEYFSKIYPKADNDTITEFAEEFVKQQKKKMYIANLYPNLKFQDIELLSDLVTNEQIVEYERELGNS